MEAIKEMCGPDGVTLTWRSDSPQSDIAPVIRRLVEAAPFVTQGYVRIGMHGDCGFCYFRVQFAEGVPQDRVAESAVSVAEGRLSEVGAVRFVSVAVRKAA